jgi:hypothetical protein
MAILQIGDDPSRTQQPPGLHAISLIEVVYGVGGECLMSRGYPSWGYQPEIFRVREG